MKRLEYTFTSDSTGMSGTWGPVGANWSFTVFVRADRPIGESGAVAGLGAVPILFSSGSIVVPYPSGGSVPAAALTSNGGPLDGVAAGWTWDQALVGQWRSITVCNNASGRRTVYVDGYAAIDSNPSTSTVASNSTFTLLSGCPVTFAEFIIWNTGDITPQEIASHRQCMRTKWKVQNLPDRIVTSFSGSFSLPQTSYAGGTLPGGLPTPSSWLDATHLPSLCTDDAGTIPVTGGNQKVKLWRDRSGKGHHVSFASSPSLLVDSAVYAINNRPVVAVSNAGPGSFVQSPISSITTSSGYTVAAVWRITSGGHPFAVENTATFSPSEWNDTLDAVAGKKRSMPTGCVCYNTPGVVAGQSGYFYQRCRDCLLDSIGNDGSDSAGLLCHWNTPLDGDRSSTGMDGRSISHGWFNRSWSTSGRASVVEYRSFLDGFG